MNPNEALDAARQLDEWGLNVLPARERTKAPLLPNWKQYQDERTSDRLATWFGPGSSRNYWIATGHISRVVVLDIDNPKAETYWRDQMGLAEQMDQTACVQTSEKSPGWHGHHYYWLIGPSERVASWSSHPTDDYPDLPSFDVRGEGTGVIAPPSLHESGYRYQWVRTMEHALPLPDALRGAERSKKAGSVGGVGGGVVQGGGRSMLAALLAKPPGGDGTGRNQWLSKIAGHYAKQFRSFEDAYRAHCEIANSLMGTPLDKREFNKTIESIWRSEQENHDERDASEDTGYLVAGDHCLMVQCAAGKGEERQVELQEWADFDIRALGVVEDEEASRVYSVEVLRKRRMDSREALLDARVLADPKTLSAWLAEFGCTVIPPEAMWPKSGSISARLTRYLESQDPPRFAVAESLGWSEKGGGFVTHEGVIRDDGIHGFSGVKPHPRLRNWAPFKYGMADEAETRAVLEQVLTFHYPDVCSVFGAWWAACLLKPQIQAMSSLFPLMALEAPSESGKTTGFFALMLQLNGNARGQTIQTVAAMRDSISANQSGIVWIDDVDDPQALFELLRSATGGGSISKKAEDRTRQVTVELTSPICITGETVGLDGQKAMIDRSIVLEVQSPVDRRSLSDPDRLQWDDIKAMMAQHPLHDGGLTNYAGTLVALALRQMPHLPALRTLRVAGGRWGDKIAILRLGARILDGILTGDTSGDGEHSRRVDAWAGLQSDLGAENSLTMKILPTCLRLTSEPDHPEPPEHEGQVPTPAFVIAHPDRVSHHDDGPAVWFSPVLLADWWSRHQHGRIVVRTETADAFAQQARALGLGGSRGVDRKQWKMRGTNSKAYYWRITGALAQRVLDRARGGDGQGIPGGAQEGAQGALAMGAADGAAGGTAESGRSPLPGRPGGDRAFSGRETGPSRGVDGDPTSSGLRLPAWMQQAVDGAVRPS